MLSPTAQPLQPSPGLPQQVDSAPGALRSGAELARRVAESHRQALSSRRTVDLTAERNILWIDGEGDLQWADIYEGQRVAIPRMLSEYRDTNNLLRPIVDNAVAYHCTKPLHFHVESRRDSAAKQQAIVDAAVINYIFNTQWANAILAQAMYLSMGTGFCPVHATWRDDLEFDPYEPLYLKPEDYAGMSMPRKGLIDLWVGNPFDTTYNEGAKRGSYHTFRYGRVLPADQVRKHFNVAVEGTDRLPSASTFQRVIQRGWNSLWGLNQHGTAALSGGRSGEELIAIICEEVAPGVEQEWPDGRLTCIALPKAADTRREGTTGGSGAAVHLSTTPLPSRRFSAVPFYSSHRFGDVHGAPWVTPLIPLQGQLNQAISAEREYIARMKDAPTIYSGTLDDEHAEYGGYTLLGVQAGGGASFTPKVMEIPQAFVVANQRRIERTMQLMYTIGGYQAASRGEAPAGDPFSKTAFLAEQDDTIHGPVNQDFRFACADLAKLCHAIFRDNAHVGWVVENVGDEFDMLGDAYVDRTRVSTVPPQFRVVSGFGATTELESRQLREMVKERGADGQPLLSTSEFRQKYPDGTLFDRNADPAAAQKRRAKIINSVIRQLTARIREENRIDANQYADPTVQQAAFSLSEYVARMYPLMQTDDAAANMAALSEMQQDETEDAIARNVAGFRWQQYSQWQQEMMAHQAQSATRIQAVANPNQQQASQETKPVGEGQAPQVIPPMQAAA